MENTESKSQEERFNEAVLRNFDFDDEGAVIGEPLGSTTDPKDVPIEQLNALMTEAMPELAAQVKHLANQVGEMSDVLEDTRCEYDYLSDRVDELLERMDEFDYTLTLYKTTLDRHERMLADDED